MAINLGKNSPLWLFVRHNVVPFLFVFGIPVFNVFITLYPLPRGLSSFDISILFGDKFSWLTVFGFIAWCIIFLLIPSKKFNGPKTYFGFTPVYVANGFQFFVATLSMFVLVNVLSPTFSDKVYEHMPQLLGCLNIIALTLCLYLWFQGRNKTQDPVLKTRLPFLFEFYRGMELHPKVFGIDIKQLVNCRIGLGLWVVLPLIFLVTSYHRHGLDTGILANVVLQEIYLAKFYWWETGYFNTLDITLDRAGFYLSWGCLCFVPGFYTFSTYYMVQYPSINSSLLNFVFFILGLISIYLNYAVDYQKEQFVASKGNCKIWGEKAKFIDGNYKDRPVKLLTNGFWGIARHINYVFELLLALFWNLPCLGLGILPFMYNIFLFILLVHRIYRDEDKCQNKYGAFWKKYCNAVPYRMIPYIY